MMTGYPPCNTPDLLAATGGTQSPHELAEAVATWRLLEAAFVAACYSLSIYWREKPSIVRKRLLDVATTTQPLMPSAPLSPPDPAACAPRSLVGQRGAILAGDAEPQARWAGVPAMEVATSD